MGPEYCPMGRIDEPTYEDFEAMGSFREVSRKEKNEIILLMIKVGVISDFTLIASRCHKLMSKELPQNNRNERNAILKKIGERYVGHCIELWLWEKGYALNGIRGNSFTIQPQFYSKDGKHRIDFRVEITTSSKTIVLMVDSKNWTRYYTKDAQRYAREHIIPFHSFTANYKLMVLNYRLIPKVNKILQSAGIKPIKVLHHLTDRRYIKNYLMLVDSLMKSIIDLINLIPIPDVSKNIRNLTTPETIKYDIELGKPYKLLEEKWDVSHSYIDKLRNQMVRSGVALPNRNTKVFTKLKQYNDYLTRN